MEGKIIIMYISIDYRSGLSLVLPGEEDEQLTSYLVQMADLVLDCHATL